MWSITTVGKRIPWFVQRSLFYLSGLSAILAHKERLHPHKWRTTYAIPLMRYRVFNTEGIFPRRQKNIIYCTIMPEADASSYRLTHLSHLPNWHPHSPYSLSNSSLIPLSNIMYNLFLFISFAKHQTSQSKANTKRSKKEEHWKCSLTVTSLLTYKVDVFCEWESLHFTTKAKARKNNITNISSRSTCPFDPQKYFFS